MPLTTLRRVPASPAARWAVVAAAALLAFVQLSCASAGFTPEHTTMTAARAGLRPEYRVFYDELGDNGDWVLVEPYGFVFRPKARIGSWSPYFDGFWSPSDSYGWVWVSSEPYGWATYHYGRWLRDDYQGWVWVPGLEWAPAWVAWSANDQYVGWAALAPNDQPAASAYHVVARGDLGATDLRSRVVPVEQAKDIVANTQPIKNYDQVDHVTVNRGPRIEWVEQVAGPLTRSRVQDMVPFGKAPDALPASDGAKSATPAAAPKSEFQRATEADARKVRTIIQQKQSAPDVIQRITPQSAPPRSQPAPSKPALRDTTR